MLNTFKKSVLAILFAGSIFLASCAHNKPAQKYPQLFPEKDVRTAKEHVEKVQKGTVEAANKIDDEAFKIRRTLNRLEEKAPKGALDIIENHAGPIRDNTKVIETQTQEIRRLAGLLEQAKAGLTIADEKISELQKQNSALTTERDDAVTARDKALSEKNDSTQKMLRWLIVVSVIIGGAGIAVYVRVSKKIGMTMIAAAGGVIVLAVALVKYFDYIALGGLVVLVGVVGYMIWRLFLQQKALKEVVHTAEVAKLRLDPEDRKQIFGEGAAPGEAFSIQSPPTENLVAQIREELKPKFEHTIIHPQMQARREEEPPPVSRLKRTTRRKSSYRR